jgi:HEAT repeat protein
VVTLAGHPFASSMRLLFAAMGDESWRVRKEAVAVLVAAQPIGVEAVEGLIELLRASDNAGLRNSAVESLVRLGESALDPLCAHLGDPDQDLRKFVIDILGTIGRTSCLPLLVEALDDPDPNVRVAAAENLGKIGDPRALPHLLKVLDGGDVWLKFTVLDALALIGAPVPLSSLTPLLRESLLRRAVYDCLGSLGDAECLPLLLQGVQERARNAREAAAVALMRVRGRLAARDRATLVDLPLKELKGSAGAKGVIASLNGADAGILESLVQVVGIIGDERGALELLGVAREERLRGGCLEAFRGIGPAALPELLAHFQGAACAERSLIAHLIGELGSDQGIDLLLTGLTDECPSVRAACASSLGRLAPPGASRCIAELLEDVHAPVREAALEALQRLSGADPAGLGGLCAELAQSALPRKRRDAALLLRGLSDGERLFLLAKDEDASVRRAAIASLARVSLPQTVGHLAMALSDEEPEVRVAAAQALSETGGPEVLEPLLLALNDPDPWVQTASLKGLSALGDPHALPGVTALLMEAKGPVLIAGLATLAAVGGAAALAPVKAALGDGDEEVVEAAIGILSGFGGDWIAEHQKALIGHPHWGVRRSFARAMVEALGAKALPALDEALAKESDPLVKDEIARLMGRFS